LKPGYGLGVPYKEMWGQIFVYIPETIQKYAKEVLNVKKIKRRY